MGYELQRGDTVVFLDISVGPLPIGRIKIKLYTEKLPQTSENFRQFCTGEFKQDGRPIGYKNSTFHRIVKDFIIQGGDFIKHDGTGSLCVFGKGDKFSDEGFFYENDRMTVSMANSGPDTNGCQFFINVGNNRELNGKHVVFGVVVEGFEVVEKLNEVHTVREKPDPVEVIVTNCGEM